MGTNPDIVRDGGYYRRYKQDVDSQVYGNLAGIVRSFLPKGGSVLDVGCGLGFLIRRLAQAGYDAWGLDPSEYAVEHNVVPDRVAHSDLTSFLQDNSKHWDLVILWQTLPLLDTKEAVRCLIELSNRCDYLLVDSGMVNPAEFTPGFPLSDKTERLVRRCGYAVSQDADAEKARLDWGFVLAVPAGPHPPQELISIILAAHNTVDYVAETIDSCWRARESLGLLHGVDCELLFMDDGSSDGTGDVAHHVANTYPWYVPPITLRSETARGPAGGRNPLIEQGLGEWFVVFDSDDAMPDDYLQRLWEGRVAGGMAYPHGWVSAWVTDDPPARECWRGAMERVPPELAMRGVAELDINGRTVTLCGNQVEMSRLEQGNFCTTQGIYDRNVLVADQWDPVLKRNVDWEMAIRLLKKGVPIERADEAWFLKRSRPHSVTICQSLARSRNHISVKHKIPRIPDTMLCSFSHSGVASEALASTRIRGIDIGRHLHELRLCDSIDQLRERWRDHQVFYFLNCQWPEPLGWALFLKAHGKTVIFDVFMADWLLSPAHKLAFETLCPVADLVTCHLESTAEKCREAGAKRTAIVRDRHFLDRHLSHRKMDYSSTGRIGWLGFNQNILQILHHAKAWNRLCEETGTVIRIISAPLNGLLMPFPNEWRKWNLDTADADLAECDIAVCPCPPFDEFRAKSTNKGSLSKMLAMPTLTGEHDDEWWVRECTRLLAGEGVRKEAGEKHFEKAIMEEESSLSALELETAIVELLREIRP